MMTSVTTHFSNCNLDQMCPGANWCMSWSGLGLVFQVLRWQAIWQVGCKAFF